MHVLSAVGVVIIGFFALGLVLKAVFGIAGGLLAIAFWAAVLAGLVALATAIWQLASGSK